MYRLEIRLAPLHLIQTQVILVHPQAVSHAHALKMKAI